MLDNQGRAGDVLITQSTNVCNVLGGNWDLTDKKFSSVISYRQGGLWCLIRHADTASKCTAQLHDVVSSSQHHPAALLKAQLLRCCFRMDS